MAANTESKAGRDSTVDEAPRGANPNERRARDESPAQFPTFKLTRWTWLRGSTPNYGSELESWEIWARSEMMSRLGKAMRMGDNITVNYDIDRDESKGTITVVLNCTGPTAEAIEKRL